LALEEQQAVAAKAVLAAILRSLPLLPQAGVVVAETLLGKPLALQAVPAAVAAAMALQQ
jgi:hypothetical protein